MLLYQLHFLKLTLLQPNFKLYKNVGEQAPISRLFKPKHFQIALKCLCTCFLCGFLLCVSMFQCPTSTFHPSEPQKRYYTKNIYSRIIEFGLIYFIQFVVSVFFCEGRTFHLIVLNSFYPPSSLLLSLCLH